MESANQNRPYYQPWRVEQSCHSREWNRPLSNAYISSLATMRPMWTAGMGILDRETTAMLVKSGSQQRYTESSAQWLQPKLRENTGTNHILQQLPSNKNMSQGIDFPTLYNHIGNSQQESLYNGVTSSRWIAAGTELIKLDPEPISRSIFKSPWSFIHNSFTMKEQVCDPGGKNAFHVNCDFSSIEAVRGTEQDVGQPSKGYITSAASKTIGAYHAKISSNINHCSTEPAIGTTFTEHYEAEYKLGNIDDALPSVTIDLTDQPQDIKDESTCSLEENKFLLIDDQGIPYTVSKKDLKLSPKANSISEEKTSLVPKRIHYCLVCFRTFLYLSDLERHSITHSERKPFECKVCGKSFKRSSHLQRHKHIHTGERPFQCSICLKGFRESGELQRHQRVHTGEKPYQCEICHLRFTERNTLRRHIKRKHSKETLYQQDAGDSSDWGETLEDNTNEDNTE